ncbi:MAG: hypothetical protein IBV52_05720 [Candidatus Bathyarchaeota archaeon]
MDSLNTQIEIIQRIVKEFPWHNDFSKFENIISFTSAPQFINKLYSVLQKHFLHNKVLFVLFDEFDELDIYQQEFIMRLIRTRSLTFRIASKIGGIKTLEYMRGKELDEIHDYDPIIPLHFETSKENRHRYQTLLKNIFVRRLTLYGNYKVKEPEKLLPNPTLEDERLSEKEIHQELQLFRQSLKKKHEIKDPESYWKNFYGHYREASIYRLLRQKGRDKIYAGFDEYVSLSSGIVRQFILLARNAFSLAHVQGIKIEEGTPIPIKIQSKAAYNESRNQLLMEITKSIPSGYGPKLVRLIRDLGRILQAKLYLSTSPQSNRFEIIDSQKFMNKAYTIPRELIENGLRMPHFISINAFKPKQPEYSLMFTFSLNGIFAPVLKIPPEKRWRTPISADELKDLCSDENREKAMSKIIDEITKKDRKVKRRKKRRKDLQSTIFDALNSPISLSNCPVTGYGCNQSLTQYITQKKNLKAFLAVPFDKNSWVADPRTWIKHAMTDHFKIRCVDVEDFPNVGPILCKICSGVRQMPIGIFEITELNPNVIFELGMATALNKLNFMLVYPSKIPDSYRKNFPPKPFSEMEYVPYELSENSIIKTIKDTIKPAILNASTVRENQWCWVIRGHCPSKALKGESKIFIALPFNRNEPFFGQVKEALEEVLRKHYKKERDLKFYKPATTRSELCQLCEEICTSSLCIIDTTYNDLSMLFALGIAFGKDKRFIQLHYTSATPERPISDLRNWAIEYRNIQELTKLFEEEISKVRL